MKIGLVTILDYNNYGNRLQNYAVQQIILSLGSDVETIKVISNTEKKSKICLIINISNQIADIGIFKFIEKIISRMINKIYIISNKKALRIRLDNFIKFTKENILETNFEISNRDVPIDLNNKYDYFITGSDQVWNPTFKRFSNLDFLTFAQREKRIAYAVSFGIDSIPLEYKARFKVWIEEMCCLSVREEAGAKIIKQLTGREAVVLIDPTMMLDKNDWLKISKESPNKPKNKFLCTYFLGGAYESYKKEITKFSSDSKLELINLNCINDLKRYSEGPSEFLDYIASCELLLTDSFHGAIFSILFNKPFVVFDRIGKAPTMSSRIETLLSKFKLEDRKWEKVMKTGDYFEVDFSHVQLILEAERNKAYEYLKHALNIKDQPLQ